MKKVYGVLWFMVGTTIVVTSAMIPAPVSAPERAVSLPFRDVRPADTPNHLSCEDISLMFTGDIMLSRYIGKLMEREQNFYYPFERIASLTASADITFGNLENPISDRGTNMGSIYSFRADPRSIAGLSHAGFDVLSLANNHIYDYGPDALVDTMRLLSDVGIKTAGVGKSYDEAHTPVRMRINDVTVSYFAYTNLLPQFLFSKDTSPAAAGAVKEKIIAAIAQERSQTDIIVTSLHWGDEYETEAHPFQVEFAHTLVDAGADIVVGHHPHVVQGFEQYKKGIIAYSLGNFIFDQNFSSGTKEGAILTVYIGTGAVCGAEKTTIHFTDTYQPYFYSVEEIFK